MERLKVESSRIESVGYDSKKKELEVIMKKNNQVYLHKEVPSNFWKELMLAPSIGKYYFNNIKDSFPYETWQNPSE